MNKGKCSYFLGYEPGKVAVSHSIRSDKGGSGVAAVAQSVERVLGKDEVMGPNPISS